MVFFFQMGMDIFAKLKKPCGENSYNYYWSWGLKNAGMW
jgi:hypothetical protein